MNIILFGAPGAGKGTQAKRLSSEHGFYQLSTGDLVRAEIASGSERGQEIQNNVDQGRFPSDAVIIDLMKTLYEKEELADRGVIFDGFPRTVNQAQVLSQMLNDTGATVDKVILLDVDPEVVKQRILGRFSCDGCGAIYNDTFHPTSVEGVCDACGGTSFTRRSDDTAEAIDQRLETYRVTTKPVIDYYRDQGSDIVVIDGAQDPATVYTDVLSSLELGYKASQNNLYDNVII